MIGDEAFAEYEGSDAAFLFYTEEDAETYGGEPGWYLADDWDYSLFLMDDVTFNIGQSFILDAGDESLKLTFSGEVSKGDEGEISLPNSYGDFNFLGNVTPVDLTLGDITLCNVVSGNSTIQFFNAKGVTAQVTKEMIGEEAFAEYEGSDAAFLFYTEEDAETYGGEPGWYLADDWDYSLFLMNDVKISAGQGFILDAGDEGLTIQIPAAIQPASK